MNRQQKMKSQINEENNKIEKSMMLQIKFVFCPFVSRTVNIKYYIE